MRVQQIGIALAGINLAILIAILVLVALPGDSPETATVLRGRSLEIVDGNGEVRAHIVVQPAGRGDDGQPHSETVLFRLMNPDGLPGVKIGTSADSAGLLLSQEVGTQWSGVQILAENASGTLRLVNQAGQEWLVQP